MAGKATVKVKIDEDRIRKVVRDAVEEAMAEPICTREHVEPMAEWERELLAQTVMPRVVTDREEFRAGQLIALINPPAMARVTKVEGRHVEIEGQYLAGPRTQFRAPVGPPLNGEIDRGQWVILGYAPGWRP